MSAAARLADSTGARLAWVPRRAGERGAIEAGALPGLLPGGRPLSDETARTQVAQGWNVADLPSTEGRDADAILAAAKDGSLGALLVGGIDAGDFADPDAVLAALDAAGFVVSLELRHGAVTERANVVFPIAPAAEKAGTYVNWEGRQRSFSGALPPTATPDCRVLDTLADELGIDLGFPTVAAGLAELNGLGTWDGAPVAAPSVAAASAPQPAAGEAILAGWRMLLDNGQLQDGEPHLAGTARAPVVRLSAATRGSNRRRRGRRRQRQHRTRRNHPAVDHHRDARPRGLAAAELAGLGGAPAIGRHARRRRGNSRRRRCRAQRC